MASSVTASATGVPVTQGPGVGNTEDGGKDFFRPEYLTLGLDCALICDSFKPT